MVTKSPYASSYREYYVDTRLLKSLPANPSLVEQYGIVTEVRPFAYKHNGHPSTGLVLALQSSHDVLEFKLCGKKSVEQLLRHAQASTAVDLIGRVVDIVGHGFVHQFEDGQQYPLITGEVLGLRLSIA